MKAAKITKIALILLVLALFASFVYADSVYITYLNPTTGAVQYGPTRNDASVSQVLANTNYSINITSLNRTFYVLIPNIKAANIPVINISAENVSEASAVSASLSIGPTTSYDYYVRDAYAFSIQNEDQINKTYTITFNDSFNISKPVIIKAGYNFVTNAIDFTSAEFLTTTASGNKVSANTDNFSVFLLTDNLTTAPTPSPTYTPSGGGGGGSGSYKKGQLYIPPAEYLELAGKKISRLYEIVSPDRPLIFPVDNEEFSIMKIESQVKNSFRMVSMRIEKMKGRPEKVEPIAGTELEYYNILYSNLEYDDITKTKITFFQKKKTLDDLGISKDKIKLYRYHAEKTDTLEELPTTIIEETEDKIIYQSEVVGLSFFIIGAKGVTPPQPQTQPATQPATITETTQTQSPEPQTQQPTQQPTSQPVPEAPAVTEQFTWLDYLQAFILFLILVVLVVGSYVIYKQKAAFKPKKPVQPAAPVQTVPKTTPTVQPKPSAKPPMPQPEPKPSTPKAKVIQPKRKIKLLEAYIYKQLAKGHNKETLKQTLVDKGWPDELIDAKLKIMPAQPAKKVKELESYIYHELSKGFKKEEIKETLLSAGWPSSAIREEFNKLKKIEKEFKKESLHEVHTDLDKVIKSVKNLLAKGYTEDQIRKLLISKGWHRAAVEIVFNDLKK